MTSDQITKLRTWLSRAQDCAKDTNIEKKMKIDSNQAYKWIMQDMFHCIDQALALLPCPTCNDSGRVPTFDQASGLADADPCPDCQKPECPVCKERRNCGVGEKCPACRS